MSEQETPVAPPVAPPAPPKFVGADKRSEVVRLDHPLEYDGKVYDSITVRRPSLPDIQAWSEEMKAVAATGGDVGKMSLPMFDAPQAVLDALDPDDDDRVAEVVDRFLPQRFREQATEPAPANGASSPSS